MEIQEAHSEMQAVLQLYSVHRWFGEGRATGLESPEAYPHLDERSLKLLKDLLDRKMESTIANLSRLVTTAGTPPNQPPPPVLKRQCSHCEQRNLNRQASIKVPDTGRSVAAASSGSWYEGSGSWTSQAETRPSRSATASSYTATDSRSSCSYSVGKPAVKPVRRPMGRAGRGRARGRPRRRSSSSYSSSTYSVEKSPRALARAGPSCWGRGRARGHEIETLGRTIKNQVKNKLGQLFQHHHHQPHAGSMWRRGKEILHRYSGNKPHSSKCPDHEVVDKKGKKVLATKNLGQKKPKNNDRRRNRNP